MFETAMVLALLGTAAITDDNEIHCDFRGGGTDGVYIVLEPSPSLWDRPDQFRLRVTMNDRTMLAKARPIADTQDRDVMINTTGKRSRALSIGLREDGRAALNIRSQNAEPRTLRGACNGNLEVIDRWLPTVE